MCLGPALSKERRKYQQMVKGTFLPESEMNLTTKGLEGRTEKIIALEGKVTYILLLIF